MKQTNGRNPATELAAEWATLHWDRFLGNSGNLSVRLQFFRAVTRLTQLLLQYVESLS